MNKGITIFILVVLLCAMGIIFYSHMGDKAPEPTGPRYTDATSPGATPTDGHRAPANGNATEPTAARPGLLGQPGTAPDAGRGSNASAPTRVLPPLTQPERTTPPAGQNATRLDSGPATTAAPGNGRAVASTEPVDNGTTPAAQSNGNGATGKTPAATPATPAATTPDTGKTPAATPATPATPAASSTPAAATPSATATHTLKSIGVHFSGQEMLLRIEADSAFPIKHFVLSNPDRLVIDLPGTWKGMKAPTVPQNNVIKAVRLGNQAAGPRLVLDLARAPTRQEVVKVSDTVVEVRVR